ncbi:hypothetical protein MAPG_11621 [Magnaporthiopsis poae ATCC 64411]|uniref:Uncharacterized protein n=1 Tax=Magnaporthiopsis poae (strain ATCC 64411 / 73-15) TaxID=644358 RepID=A0A0C4EFR5_MAGP6|nr:hypothetical protein MAPG_11621 [Magnaporthiopsis poae ATCC 64411]
MPRRSSGPASFILFPKWVPFSSILQLNQNVVLYIFLQAWLAASQPPFWALIGAQARLIAERRAAYCAVSQGMQAMHAATGVLAGGVHRIVFLVMCDLHHHTLLILHGLGRLQKCSNVQRQQTNMEDPARSRPYRISAKAAGKRLHQGQIFVWDGTGYLQSEFGGCASDRDGTDDLETVASNLRYPPATPPCLSQTSLVPGRTGAGNGQAGSGIDCPRGLDAGPCVVSVVSANAPQVLLHFLPAPPARLGQGETESE